MLYIQKKMLISNQFFKILGKIVKIKL